MMVTKLRGIRQRGNSYLWDVTVEGKRITGTCSSAVEAEAARSEALKGLKSTSKVEPWSLQKAVDAAHEEWERQGSKSMRMNTINTSAALKFFGAKRKITDITKGEIKSYTKHLAEMGNSPATINRKLSALSKVISVSSEQVSGLDVPRMPRYKEGRGRERFLSTYEENQLIALLNSWGKSDHADAVVVLLDTGIRTGELFKFIRREVAFKGGKATSITLSLTKNGRDRTVPLTARASEVITRRCKGLQDGSRVFDYNQGWLRNTWDRAREVLGYSADPQFVPHILRHTTASRLAQRGIPLPIIKEYMGHLSIQTTMRYAHLTVDSLQQAVSVLEQGIAS